MSTNLKPFAHPNALSVLAYANGFTLWHYRSKEHTLEDIGRGDYFVEHLSMLRNRDRIMITAKDGDATAVVRCGKAHVRACYMQAARLYDPEEQKFRFGDVANQIK